MRYEIQPGENFAWIPGHLKGQDVVIVGGGYSVGEVFGSPRHDITAPDIDVSRFLGCKKIVINHAAKYVTPDFYVMIDQRAQLTMAGFDWYNLPYPVIVGHQIQLEGHGNVSRVVAVDQHRPLSIDPKIGFYSAHSGGQYALSLALCMEARNIFLIGFDAKEGYPSHFYDGRKDKAEAIDQETYIRMTEMFKKFSGFSNIYNLNQWSGIDIFPKISYDEFARMVG